LKETERGGDDIIEISEQERKRKKKGRK